MPSSGLIPRSASIGTRIVGCGVGSNRLALGLSAKITIGCGGWGLWKSPTRSQPLCPRAHTRVPDPGPTNFRLCNSATIFRCFFDASSATKCARRDRKSSICRSMCAISGVMVVDFIFALPFGPRIAPAEEQITPLRDRDEGFRLEGGHVLPQFIDQFTHGPGRGTILPRSPRRPALRGETPPEMCVMPRTSGPAFAGHGARTRYTSRCAA